MAKKKTVKKKTARKRAAKKAKPVDGDAPKSDAVNTAAHISDAAKEMVDKLPDPILARVMKLCYNPRLVIVKPYDEGFKPGRMIVPYGPMGDKVRVLHRNLYVKPVPEDSEVYEFVR